MELYESRLRELKQERGRYRTQQAAMDYAAILESQGIDYFAELNYCDRKRIHNLKYYTWVEQQGKTYEELMAQWDPGYWAEIFEKEADYFDALIDDFNKSVGLAD
jgi:hypothetical protein